MKIVYLLVAIGIVGLILFGLRPLLATPLDCSGTVDAPTDQLTQYRTIIFGTRCSSARLSF